MARPGWHLPPPNCPIACGADDVTTWTVAAFDKALDGLLDEGHVYLHPLDCIATTPVRIVTAEDWLE